MSHKASAATLGAVSVAAVAWCLSDLLTGSRLPVYRDLLLLVYPYRAFLGEHLARGEVPFWNPFVQLGIPFMASLHAGVFYPPSAILLLPLPLGFNLFLVAHFVIAWTGALAWLRQQEASPAGAAVGALAFTIGGYLAASVTNTAHLQAAVWAPWIFFAWGRACAGRSGFTATVLFLVVQLLAGAPEVWMSTVGLLVVWTLFVAAPTWSVRGKFAFQLGACIAIVIGLAAFQLLPTFEYLAHSRRSSLLPLDELTYWSMSPVSLLQLIFPHSTALVAAEESGIVGDLLEPRLPLVHSIYVGAAGLCLAVAGIGRDRERVFWALVAASGVLLALGPHSFVYPLLVDLAPALLGRIRYPEKFLYLFHVGITALVARGATAAFRGERGATRLSIVVASTVAAVALGFATLARFWPVDFLQTVAVLAGEGGQPLEVFFKLSVDLAYKAGRAFWLFAAWAGLCLLYLRGRVRPALFQVLAIALLAGDLASTHRGLWLSVPFETLERTPLRVDVSAMRARHERLFHYALRSGPHPVPGLVQPSDTLLSRSNVPGDAAANWATLSFATGMLYGIGNISAGDSIASLPTFDTVLATLPRQRAVHLLGAFNVSVLIGREAISTTNVQRVPSDEPGSHLVYRLRDVLPFAFLVSELEVVPAEAPALRRLADPSFPRDRRAVVSRLPDGWIGGSESSGSQEGVELRSLGTDSIELSVSCRRMRLLVVSSAYFPGWIAEVDGNRVELLRTNALVKGVVVPAGQHRVRLAYEPASFRTGGMISLATLLAALLCAAAVRRHSGADSRSSREPHGRS